MAPPRPHNGGSGRVVSPAVDAMQNPSSRLPSRTAIPPATFNDSTSSPSKLLKKRPSSKKGSELPTMASRSASVGGVRRLVGHELRRELEQPAVPTYSGTSKASPAKPKSQPASRAVVSEPARTPSLVSGSSVSTVDSPRSNRLRRKHSNIGKQNIRTSPESSSSREGMEHPGPGYEDPYPDAVLGIAIPPVSSTYTPKDPHDDVIHLDQYVLEHPSPVANELPPPTPLYALSSTPSTGYSPGPFSISSTPTSMSSASPSIASTAASRPKQIGSNRSRPLVSRTFTDETDTSSSSRGLAPVRESSSSSTSTLRGGEVNRARSKSRVKPMPVPSPSPPPPPPPSSTSHHRRSSSGAKSTRNSATIAGKNQVLPEFAHLVDPSPRNAYAGGSVPPTRPSRDGAPEIIVQEKSPVVQSNMPSLPTALHKRQSSADAKRAVTPLTVEANKSRFGLPRTRTVSPSPSQSSAMSPRTTAPSRGLTPDIPSESETSSRARASPVVDSKPFSRFGFFSRKNKNEPNATAVSKEKKTRKGPVAGTGHEGYGRFAFRGRSGSTTSGSGTASVGRSPSADSAIGAAPLYRRKGSFGSKNGSSSDFEDFLAEREKPIAIRGGQATRPAVERSQTEVPQVREEGATQDVQFVPPSWDSATTSLEPSKRPVLLPSPMSDSLMSGSPVKRDAPVKAPKEEKSSLPSLSTLTSRRVSRRSFLGGKALAIAQRAEIEASQSSRKDSELSQGGQQISNIFGEEDAAASSRADIDTQPSLKPPSKWNFLQRSKSPARQGPPAPAMENNFTTRQRPQRSIAHYAMVGAPTSIDAAELERIMQEAEGSTPDDGSNSDLERIARTKRKGKAVARHGNSILLPEPPKFVPAFAAPPRPASPKVTLNPAPAAQYSPELPQSPPQTTTASPPSSITIVGQPRPSRLPQVGRIPRVVSKRDRERKLSDNSFSRPFQPTQPSPALKNGSLSPSASSPENVRANFGTLSDLALASATKGLQKSSDDLSLSPHFSPPLGFMAFPPRKNSEQSTNSSGSGYFSAVATTAVIPAPDAPLSDDEVWNEYDDIEDVLPSKAPKTPKTPMTGSSLGAPFQYAEFSPKDAATVHRPSTAPSDYTADAQPEMPKPPTLASIAQQIRVPSMHDSRIVSALPSAGTPRSPFRMSDFVAGYGERNLSVIDPVSGRLSMPSTGRQSTSTNGRFSLPSTIRPQSIQQGQTLPSTRHTPSKSESTGRDSRIMERAETEYMGFENLANLRFGALMTSKWLSFGRVLFSPAHVELNARGENRVLILDGLGKDWSFYVALNYPNASVYNLGAEPAEASDHAADTASPIQSLPNHRHIYHPSLRDPFPFPKGFFAAVVFRFPVATTESTYKSAIFECKRVLRPGGYLEISALDMDMMNMGSRARSALRGLKTQMQAEDSSISLKPLSDTFQRLLYRRGFENLNRCFVGIPAAGRIPGSRDESSEEPNSASVESSTGSSKKMDEDLPSFGDLIRAQGQAGDDGVTKMVSKVGRWWYSRCYESLTLPNGDVSKSIWVDDSLVRECEKRGTNIKLMICYAQKPDCPVRRTISV